MQITANFLQLDQMTTIAPIKHFEKHVGAHSNDKLDKLFSFSVSFLSFVRLSNFWENFLLNFLLEYVYKMYIKWKTHRNYRKLNWPYGLEWLDRQNIKVTNIPNPPSNSLAQGGGLHTEKIAVPAKLRLQWRSKKFLVAIKRWR